MGKRSLENRIESAEQSRVSERGGDALPPEIARVRDRIIEKYDHEAYMEILASVVVQMLPPSPAGPDPEERPRTEAGWPDPTPGSHETAFESETERDEAIEELARAWTDANSNESQQREGELA